MTATSGAVGATQPQAPVPLEEGPSPEAMEEALAGEPPDESPDQEPGEPAAEESVRLSPGGRRRWLSWGVTLAVTLVAALVRLPHLSRPSGFVFDETYYAKDAWSLLRYGVETTPEGAPAFVVHPPLGKWMIALGEWPFGFTETGWRISAAVTGTLTVAVLVRAARRLTGSTALGALAGLLLAFDGLSVVMSRTSMLDIFLTFWVVAAFALLLMDRDTMDARAAAGWDVSGRVPGRARWWRLAAAACLGAALATKWSGAYFAIAMIGLSLTWDLLRRRRSGRPLLPLMEIPATAAVFILVPGAVYLASWTGWLAADGSRAWGRDGGDALPGPLALLPSGLRALVAYHEQMLHFHTTLTADHAYASSPWGWLVLRRPVVYYFESGPGCGGTCAEAVHALGTPLLWWGFLVTIPLVGILGTIRHDWRAAAALVPGIAGLVPWLLTPERTMFLFYALPSIPFLVLTTTLAFSYAARKARTPARVAAGAYVVVVAANLLYLLPILTAERIPYDDWLARMWLRSWI